MNNIIKMIYHTQMEDDVGQNIIKSLEWFNDTEIIGLQESKVYFIYADAAAKLYNFLVNKDSLIEAGINKRNKIIAKYGFKK